MTAKMLKWIPIVFVFFISLFSCAVVLEMQLETDGSGAADFHIEIIPVFLETIREMSELAGGAELPEDGTIFDPEKLEEDFSRIPAITLAELESPTPEILDGSFRYHDIEKIFLNQNTIADTGIISFSKEKDETTIRILLERDNFSQILSLLPILDNPFFQILGPEENEGISEDEYLEILELVLGEEGPPAVENSELLVTVNVKGKIISQSGGEIIGSSVVYTIPLLDVLLLAEPLEYELTFK
jgi:hypothetical protein